MIELNDIAPHFSLSDTNGKIVSLPETLRAGHNVLLIFLRHLG